MMILYILIGLFVLAISYGIFYRLTSTDYIKEVVYEHGMRFYRQHKFLWWDWWEFTAEGGSMGTLDKDGFKIHNGGMGKELKVMYKDYSK